MVAVVGWRDNRLALSKVGERQDGLRKSWFFNQTNHTLLTREKLENDIKFGWFVGLMESDMRCQGEKRFFSIDSIWHNRAQRC